MYRQLRCMAVIVLVTGCSNKLEAIADNELADTMHECRVTDSQSPGMAIRCDNIERECARRREEGRFVC